MDGTAPGQGHPSPAGPTTVEDALALFPEDPADALVRRMRERGLVEEANRAAHPPPRRSRAAVWALVSALAALLLAAAGVAFFANEYVPPGPPVHAPQPPDGDLTVESLPAGALVAIDDRVRGTTPLRLRLPVGQHRLTISAKAGERDVTIDVTPDSHLLQHFEITAQPRTGLRIETVPSPASIAIDGVERGTSPLEIPEIAAGQHRLSIRAGDALAERTIDVRNGQFNSVVLSLAFSSAPHPAERQAGSARVRPATGLLSITAPLELVVYENGQIVGVSGKAALRLVAGSHTLQLRNDDLGYTATRDVQIDADQHAVLTLAPPNGLIDINAIPWAAVWLDGRPIGDTPIAHLPAPVGIHQLVFRHPELGEQRRTVVVALTAPARVGVTFRQ